MAVPLDAIRAFHNAFRRDMIIMDEAANAAAHNQGNLDLVLKRYKFFNEVLVWHAVGEEKFVFPAMEKVAPLVSQPYELDHHGLDSLFGRLDKAVGYKDPIEIARVTAAFRFHSTIHLDKEDAHLYRIYNERISIPEQLAINGNMAREISRERFPELVDWIYPLIGNDDRENMTRIWQQALPQEAFAGVVKLIRTATGIDWPELVRRIPELNNLGQKVS